MSESKSGGEATTQVEHIVFLSLSEIDDEKIQTIRSILQEIKDNIPGVLNITFGKNFTSRSREWNAALVARFASKEVLEVYTPHPSHQKLVEFIAPFRTDIIAIDYEIE